MKNLFLSLFLVSSLALNASARQTLSTMISVITDWCYQGSTYNFTNEGWTELREYKECGGTATMVTYEKHVYAQE